MYRDDLISSSFPTPELAVGEKGIGEDISEWAVRGMFSALITSMMTNIF